MRKLIIVTISLLFVAVSTFAQQPGSNAISIFVTDAQLTRSQGETRFGTDFGAALEHQFSRRFSGELSVTNQHSNQFFTTSGPTGSPTTVEYSERSYPIDATVAYHFFTESRWRPYLGGGLRYVSDTIRRANTTGGSYRFTTRSVEPEIAGGIVLQLTPRLGLRFDAKQVINRGTRPIADPEFKGAVGLSLRF
ncbi:MAG: hypothetical protein QOK37_3830 [Thermoanaerobaculia bacterium]|jgi:outer membrane protein W|nr:hypothetical protein [Thermoanaerobaculia bacterium]